MEAFMGVLSDLVSQNSALRNCKGITSPPTPPPPPLMLRLPLEPEPPSYLHLLPPDVRNEVAEKYFDAIEHESRVAADLASHAGNRAQERVREILIDYYVRNPPQTPEEDQAARARIDKEVKLYDKYEREAILPARKRVYDRVDELRKRGRQVRKYIQG